MQFEVIKKSHKKEVVIGVSVIVAVVGVLLVRNSFAKYQTVKNMKIVEGTINYKIPDFKIMAMYKQKEGNNCTEDNCYEEVTDRMPTGGYVINTSKSYCTVDNTNKDTEAVLKTINDNHIISNLAKNDKCYLYFDKTTASDKLLNDKVVKEETPIFGDAATADEGVFKAKDESGKDSYYFRGAVTNNYVKFADKYWRIIRINGDGTIRIILDGDSVRGNGTTSTATQIGTSAFNSSYANNMYVGFKYTSGQVHGTATQSTILGVLNSWYNNNLTKYASSIDTNAGFCGDRTPSTSTTTSNGQGGTGNYTTTYYGAYIRLVSSKSPNLDCSTEDFYTLKDANKGNKSLDYPIGLISADEVAMAGGTNGKENNKYYLYTNQVYWTMSPAHYAAGANCAGYCVSSDRGTSATPAVIFAVWSNGSIGSDRSLKTYDVRPVINLKADTKLTGTGTASDPYVVQ